MAKAKSAQNPESESGVINQVVEIIRFMGENKLSEIDLETSEMKLSLKKHSNMVFQQVQAPVVHMQTAPVTVAENKSRQKEVPASAGKAVEAEEKTNAHKLLSPMTGTFYRAPSPTSEPFVKVGDSVTAGQTVCIVEAMKMMNEIKADKAGKVIKILFENGKPVEKGSVLVHIEV